MRLPSPFSLLFSALLVISTGSAIADGDIPGWNRFVYLIYKLEVTNYCSITTEQAGLGFQIQRGIILEQYKFSKEEVNSAQAEAWKLAYREWDNRGLGGFRRWCKNEGTSYQRYLEQVASNNSG